MLELSEQHHASVLKSKNLSLLLCGFLPVNSHQWLSKSLSKLIERNPVGCDTIVSAPRPANRLFGQTSPFQRLPFEIAVSILTLRSRIRIPQSEMTQPPSRLRLLLLILTNPSLYLLPAVDLLPQAQRHVIRYVRVLRL